MAQKKLNLNFTIEDILGMSGVEGFDNSLRAALGKKSRGPAPTNVVYQFVALENGVLTVEAAYEGSASKRKKTETLAVNTKVLITAEDDNSIGMIGVISDEDGGPKDGSYPIVFPGWSDSPERYDRTEFVVVAQSEKTGFVSDETYDKYTRTK